MTLMLYGEAVLTVVCTHFRQDTVTLARTEDRLGRLFNAAIQLGPEREELMADMVTEGAHCPRLGVPCSMGTLLCIGELTEVIHEVRRHLDSIRAEIAALPDDQQREATAAILSATQSLGDLYSDFAADMLRILCSQGSA